MTDFIVAAEFSNEIDASIAAGMLADNGIEAQILSNNMATLYAAGSTWAPVRLMVPSDCLAEARCLLHEHGDI